MTEYIVVVGVVALLAVVGYRTFGRVIEAKAGEEGQHVPSLTPYNGDMRGGRPPPGGPPGSTPPASSPPPTGSGAPPPPVVPPPPPPVASAAPSAPAPFNP